MSIILGGEKFDCRAPVLTWEETGLEFKKGRGARRRTQDIDLFVWHWTGGEREPPGMFKTLQERNLGVEFAISREEVEPGYAMIYQFADPIYIDTFDAGKVNRFSAGCEVINYGYRRLKNAGRIPKKGRDREKYKTKWNDRNRTFARFYPHQLRSSLALADAICESKMTSISKAVPRDIGHHGERKISPLRRTMTMEELRSFSGHVGHNHVSKRKSDPGTDLLQHLIDNGY